MTFLFWNLNKKPLESLIAAIAKEHRVDVLLLAENSIPITLLLRTINANSECTYIPAFAATDKILILSLLPDGAIQPIREFGGTSIRRIVPPVGVEIILAVAHLPSKLHKLTDDQSFLSNRLARLLDEVEVQLGHRRTLLVGDLNMNPFEPGVAAADGLHGVMTRNIAKKISRSVDGEEKRFFYNPMWSHLGDRVGQPAGTYYYRGGQVCYFWNVFDQVLVRPDLLDCFRDEDLKILTSAGQTALLNSSDTPNRVVGSDHLPVLFKLNLT